MEHKQQPSRELRSQYYVDGAIRIAFLGLIFAWCFLLFRPFLTVIIWAMIIAVTAHPLVVRIARSMGGRYKLAVVGFTLTMVIFILLPGFFVASSVVDTGRELAGKIDAGALEIPPPAEKVKEWPVVGDRAYAAWASAARSVQSTVRKYGEQVRNAVGWLLKGLATFGVDILLTIIALLVAALLMINAESGWRAAVAFFDRIVGHSGEAYASAARDTVRSVVKGVVLVALIQSVLAWVGFAFVELPGSGVWAVIVLLLAVMQLPPLIVLLPIAIYVFSYAHPTTAAIFLAWSILVSLSDGFLKPLFLGRGLKTPMVVILIGAIGGMIMHGIIGLFIGAVILSLGYDLYNAWLRGWELTDE